MNAEAQLPHKHSWLRTFKAVLWSFAGLRRNAEGQQDLESLHPVQILVVAIAMAVVFVLGLIALVNWVAARAIVL